MMTKMFEFENQEEKKKINRIMQEKKRKTR